MLRGGARLVSTWGWMLSLYDPRPSSLPFSSSVPGSTGLAILTSLSIQHRDGHLTGPIGKRGNQIEDEGKNGPGPLVGSGKLAL